MLASGNVTVDAASPEMHYDAAGVNGVVTRAEIDALPLNGRNCLELAKLEPGVQPPGPANRNRTIVPILGAPAPTSGERGSRLTARQSEANRSAS